MKRYRRFINASPDTPMKVFIGFIWAWAIGATIALAIPKWIAF